MEGELVFHLELHIGRAHLLTWGKDGRDLEVLTPVDKGQVPLYIGDVQDFARRKGGQIPEDASLSEPAVPRDPHAPDGALDHLKVDKPLFSRLLRDIHEDCRVTRVVIDLFQDASRLLHVLGGLVRPRIWLKRLLHRLLGKKGVAVDDERLDSEGCLLFGPYRPKGHAP